MTTADEAALLVGLAVVFASLGAYAAHLLRLRARLPRQPGQPARGR